MAVTQIAVGDTLVFEHEGEVTLYKVAGVSEKRGNPKIENAGRFPKEFITQLMGEASETEQAKPAKK